MVLYASSKKMEEMIFIIRKALIKERGNVTKAAEELKLSRIDVWAIIEDHHECFDDLLTTGKADSNLLYNLTVKAEKDSAEAALRVSGGEIQLAANILGIKRQTLYERFKRYANMVLVDSEKEDASSASASKPSR